MSPVPLVVTPQAPGEPWNSSRHILVDKFVMSINDEGNVEVGGIDG